MKRISLFSATLFLTTILALAALYYRGDTLGQRIANLQGQNQKLKENNIRLQRNIAELQLKIDSSTLKIASLEKEDSKVEHQHKAAQHQITQLKPKYEKADTFSRNYNVDSIRLYLSNL